MKNEKIEKLISELGIDTITSYLNLNKKEYHYTDIKTYEDAVRVLPVNEDDIIYNTDSEYNINLKQLRHVIRAINGVDNWIKWDGEQPKYYNWFKVSASGGDFVCVFTCYGYGCADSGVGSRLLFISKDKAEYTAKQFIELYKKYLL
jgi:hypothetical protein